MTDKKLTDEEIIKSLECCSTDRGDCDKCALQKECKNTPFYTAAAKVALDLINRQKAEIERLKECPSSNFKTVEQIKAEAYKTFAERLKSYLLLNKKGQMSVVTFENINNLLKEMDGE